MVIELILGMLGGATCPVQEYWEAVWERSPVIRDVYSEASARQESLTYHPWDWGTTTEVQGTLGQQDLRVVAGIRGGWKTGGLDWSAATGVEGPHSFWTQFSLSWNLAEGWEDGRFLAVQREKEYLGLKADLQARETAVAALRTYFQWENSEERRRFLLQVLAEDQDQAKALDPREAGREEEVRRSLDIMKLEVSLLQTQRDVREAEIALSFYLPQFIPEAPSPVPLGWLRPFPRALPGQFPETRLHQLNLEKENWYQRTTEGESGPRLALRVNRTVSSFFQQESQPLRSLLVDSTAPWSWRLVFTTSLPSPGGRDRLARVLQEAALHTLQRSEAEAWMTCQTLRKTLENHTLLLSEQRSWLQVQEGLWQVGQRDSQGWREAKRVAAGMELEIRRLERELAWRSLDYQARFHGNRGV